MWSLTISLDMVKDQRKNAEDSKLHDTIHTKTAMYNNQIENDHRVDNRSYESCTSQSRTR